MGTATQGGVGAWEEEGDRTVAEVAGGPGGGVGEMPAPLTPARQPGSQHAGLSAPRRAGHLEVTGGGPAQRPDRIGAFPTQQSHVSQVCNDECVAGV